MADIFMDQHTLIFLNADESGNILNDYLAGPRVLPEKSYRYFFYIPDKTTVDIENLAEKYRVENGQLVLK
jgi:hypothetical protein